MNEKKSLELIWNKEGQQGDEWFHEELTIKSAEKYQVNDLTDYILSCNIRCTNERGKKKT